MKPRKRLPDDRPAATRKVKLGANGEYEMYIIVGFFPNMQPGELFVKIAKNGSVINGLVDGWAVACSCLLQSGWPWALIAKKVEHTNFEPRDLKYSSIYDAVAKNVTGMISEFGGNPEVDYAGMASPESSEEP